MLSSLPTLLFFLLRISLHPYSCLGKSKHPSASHSCSLAKVMAEAEVEGVEDTATELEAKLSALEAQINVASLFSGGSENLSPVGRDKLHGVVGGIFTT
jgi:hypothetical protein